MRTFLWLTIMATGLFFFGCDSSEQPKKQTSSAVKQPIKTADAKKSVSTEATIPAMAAAQAAADKTQEKADLKAKMAEDSVEESAEVATANVEKQTASARAMAEHANEKAATTTTEAAIPQEIILEASYGNITLPHGMHAENNQCLTCHGDEDPASFDITKEVAHKLCKGCHKDEGAGPTACKGCHKK
jgi:predicted CXXCH cytochrome family protein